MIRIEAAAWERMLEHARSCYPEEACGAMVGVRQDTLKCVWSAVPLDNVWAGSRRSHYRVDPSELLGIERAAQQQGGEVLGIYHSHPDEEAYFSQTDLQNACPWYCYLVLSIRAGVFAGASGWQPDEDLSAAAEEPLWLPGASGEESKCPGS